MTENKKRQTLEPVNEFGYKLSLAEIVAFKILAFGHREVNYDFERMCHHIQGLRDNVRSECSDYDELADFKF